MVDGDGTVLSMLHVHGADGVDVDIGLAPRGVRFFAKVVYTVGVVVVVGYIKAARAAFGTFCYFRDIQRKKEKVLVGWYHCRNRELKPSQHATFNAHAPLHAVQL